MKYILALLCTLAFAVSGLGLSPVYAAGGLYTVQQGDTLSAIAYHHGLTVEELLLANGLTWESWVYAGQQLTIPDQYPAQNYTPSASMQQPATTYQSITVQPGDTLSSIAAQYGLSVNQLATANGLYWNSWLYTGQTLTIPGLATTPTVDTAAYNQPTPPTVLPLPSDSYTATSYGERWIEVNLTTQTVTAYEGQVPVYSALTSTGTWQYPTVVGTYEVYVKYDKTRMRGGYGADAYDLPDVPYVMYFYRGYGLHGTYWHNNFGTPMSHGCVNLSISDAEWVYNWASVGTKVVTHY